MKTLLMSLMMSTGLLLATAHAQAPAAAPAGSTGLCRDGTYYSGESKKGACRGHQGVKEWYGGASTPAASNDDATAKPKKSRTPESSDTATAAAPPAGATGLCKDGTYYTGESKKGACRGHQGVKDWYGAPAAPAKTAPAAPAPMPAPAAPAPASTAAPAPMPTRITPVAPPATRPAVAGGGDGKVWLNSETKVYHCPGDRYYGTTKHGEYMSEADAIAKGAHGSHGKSCAK